MEWYEIGTWLVGIVGGLGGFGGILSVYMAKPNKDALEIKNFQCLIDEERKERELIRQEARAYREEVNKRILSFKGEFDELRRQNQRQIAAIYQGYRCTLPKNMLDCPVVKMFQENLPVEEPTPIDE